MESKCVLLLCLVLLYGAEARSSAWKSKGKNADNWNFVQASGGQSNNIAAVESVLTVPSTSVIAWPGKDVELVVTTTTLPANIESVSWSFQGTGGTAFTQIDITNSARHSKDKSKDGEEDTKLSLTIKKPKKSDAGQYQCTVTIDGEDETATIQLEFVITEPNHMVLQATPGEGVWLDFTQHLELSCKLYVDTARTIITEIKLSKAKENKYETLADYKSAWPDEEHEKERLGADNVVVDRTADGRSAWITYTWDQGVTEADGVLGCYKCEATTVTYGKDDKTYMATTNINGPMDKIEMMSTRIRHMSTKLDKLNEEAKQVVHFSAGLSADANPNINEKLVFDHEITASDHYDHAEGVFKCPNNGYYDFSFTALSTGTVVDLQLVVKRGEDVTNYVKVKLTTSGSMGSNSAILKLETDDEVYVEAITASRVAGGTGDAAPFPTTFTGSRLMSLADDTV